LPVISVAVIAVVAIGTTIALPASMAGTHRTVASSAAPPDQAKRAISGVTAHAGANRDAGRLVPPSDSCLVTYTASTWPGAFTAKVIIDNRGTTSISGWKLTFTFPGDEAISSAWNAAFTQTGSRVSATSTNYDAAIPPGGRQALGFLGAWTSDNAAPASFSVNGTACSDPLQANTAG
jgi:cellulase/cellobiase CelA1